MKCLGDDMASSKREDILHAALNLFSVRGYDGTTVPMIADKAGVGAGTIYRYFENKEALVNALYQQCLQKFSDTLKDQFPMSSNNIREQFRHLFFRMVCFAQNNIDALTFIESHTSGHYLDENSHRMFDEFMGFLGEILDKGKQDGTICDLPSDALIAIVYGAFVRLYKVIRNGTLIESPEFLMKIEQCCWNAIRHY